MTESTVASRPRVAFVYANSRLDVSREVATGDAPDSTLLGENHLAEFGYDAFIHEPRIKAVDNGGILPHRLRWSMREVVVPWDLRDTDIVLTSLFNVLPTAARLRRRPRTVVLDFALATILDRRRRAGRHMLMTSLRSATAIVCLSESQRSRLLERTAIDPDRVHAVLLGVDCDFMQPRRATPTSESGYVLAVGKDLARDYRTLCETASSIDAAFVVVTEDRNIRGIDPPPNVDVRRDLAYDELRDLYANARCVVLPLRRLGYPQGTESGGLTALLETMAMGKPVVVSDRPVVHEYVQTGKSALVVPPEDPRSLAEAVNRLLADDHLAAEMGAAARRRAEEHHTMRQFAQGLARVFDHLH